MTIITQKDWETALSSKDATQLSHLVYADWLDERCEPGKPGWPPSPPGGGISAQGELIRLQIELENIERKNDYKNPQRRAIIERQEVVRYVLMESISSLVSSSQLKKRIKEDYFGISFHYGLCSRFRLYGPLVGPEVTDKTLTEAVSSPLLWSLKFISFEETAITDAGISALDKLEGLKDIRFNTDPTITDDGVRTISKAKYSSNLQSLVLAGTGVTDDAIRYLLEMPKLANLSLERTRVTRDGFIQILESPMARNLDYISARHSFVCQNPHSVDAAALTRRIMGSDLKDETRNALLQDLRLHQTWGTLTTTSRSPSR